jgi:hypothetical protein
MPASDPAAQLALRCFLAWLLLAAAAHKLRHAEAFRAAVLGYALVPQRLAGALARALPALELAAGVALLAPPPAARAGAAAAAALFALYAGAIGANLARGRRHIDCGCAGPGARQTLGPALVARNALLVAAAALAALPPVPRAWLWLDAVTVAGGAGALALLYAAADLALSHAPRVAALRGGS